MSKGIVSKVWNIKGESVKKNTTSQLKDSIDYILNGEKINGFLEMELAGQLGRECKYVSDDIKTVSGALVGGRNLVSTNTKEAVKEMMEVKKFYEKTDGRAALHGIISLSAEESDISNASKLMQLCDDVMREIFPNHQVIYGIHTNTDNLHIHFILNSVGLDGKKIYQDKHFIKKVFHPCVNKYAEKYGFTPNEKWRQAQQLHKNKKSFPDIKVMVRTAIDHAVENSKDFNDFLANMKMAGYEVYIGKYISVKNQEMGKSLRTHQLGANYTREAIVERITTRKQAFVEMQINSYVVEEKIRDVFSVPNMKMRKYKDMSPEQKAYVVKQLRLGKNPWREHQKQSWQLNNIADQINLQNRVMKYMEFYSSDGSVQGTLSGMLDAKKRIAVEKKMIFEQKKKYKPIIDIYEEMKQYEKRAYLYEHEGKNEYRVDFEKYRILTRRLKDGFNKEAPEVAAFLDECDERIVYANAQLNELSLEYREVARYAASVGIQMKKNNTVVDLMDIYDEERKKSVRGNWYYIASNESDVIFQIMESPEVKNGKLVQGYTLTVISRTGEMIEEIKNTDGNKEFALKVRELEQKYNMENSSKFSDANLAREYAAVNRKVNKSESISYESNNTVSFTQAVNHCTDSKICVMADTKTSAYFAVSSVNGSNLKIIVFNSDNKIAEGITVPLVKKATQEGYDQLIQLQKKYGFSDQLVTFDTVEKAREYIDSKNVHPEHQESHRREEWRI